MAAIELERFAARRLHALERELGEERLAGPDGRTEVLDRMAYSRDQGVTGVPFFVVAPESTVDMRTASGADIEIEDRGTDEVAGFGGMRAAPEGITAVNPAFDVTPHELITAIITERRVVRPQLGETLADTPFGPLLP